LQIILFAPLAILFLRVISGANAEVSYEIVAKSVAVFLGIPLGAAIVTRFGLRKLVSPTWNDKVFLKLAAPWSLIGLLFTILVLFASQGRQVVHQIMSVVRIAAPLIVYFGVIFFLTLLVTHKLGFGINWQQHKALQQQATISNRQLLSPSLYTVLIVIKL
jgi:ACR3 family arsenite transporter